MTVKSNLPVGVSPAGGAKDLSCESEHQTSRASGSRSHSRVLDTQNHLTTKKNLINSYSSVTVACQRATKWWTESPQDLNRRVFGRINRTEIEYSQGFDSVNNRKPLYYWCLGRESNPHSREDRGILSPLRLPVPPPRRLMSEQERTIFFLKKGVKA